MSPEHETFFSLLTDVAHWEFEIFLQLVLDILIGLIIWPFFRKKVLHHRLDDQKIEALEKQMKEVCAKLLLDKQSPDEQRPVRPS
jgi:hypothetical protein